MGRSKWLPIFVIPLAILMISAGGLAERGPSTPQERAKVVELTEKLENKPLGRTAPDDRRWLYNWLVEVPDVVVTVCGYVIELVGDRPEYLPSGLMVQALFGAASFVIQFPELADDEPAKQLAGTESMLRAYESTVSRVPLPRIDKLDELLELRERGELASWVSSQVIECFAAEE